MRVAGLLVMPTGFFLSIAALVLFPDAHSAARVIFVVCGLGVEALGLAVAMRPASQSQGKPRT